MTLKEALEVSHRIVCHQCQTVRQHSVTISDEDAIIVFTCDTCGDETDEFNCDIAKEQ